MFFPRCPQCGSKSESIEDKSLDHAAGQMGRWASLQATHGHPHPLVKLASAGIWAGRELYKRMPGGGLKKCKDCGHEFR